MTGPCMDVSVFLLRSGGEDLDQMRRGSIQPLVEDPVCRYHAVYRCRQQKPHMTTGTWTPKVPATIHQHLSAKPEWPSLYVLGIQVANLGVHSCSSLHTERSLPRSLPGIEPLCSSLLRGCRKICFVFCQDPSQCSWYLGYRQGSLGGCRWFVELRLRSAA